MPLTYAPKKKITLRFEQDPNIDRPSAVTLPRMSFEIANNLQYDGTRTLGQLKKHVVKNDDNANKMKYNFAGVPYNIPFNLYIYAKNTDDIYRIVEQILKFFAPEFTASLQLIPSMNITRDVPVIITGTQFEDSYDGSFKDRQIMVYTLSFTMKAWYFGPVYDKPIIKFANTNFYTSNVGDNTDPLVTIRVTPGMDANGVATSNSLVTIDANEIFVDDDFGFVVEVDGIEPSGGEE